MLYYFYTFSLGRWVRRKCRDGCQRRCFCFTPDPTQTFQESAEVSDHQELLKSRSRYGKFDKRKTDADDDDDVAQIQVDEKIAISATSILSARWTRRLMFLYILYLIPFITGGQ